MFQTTNQKRYLRGKKWCLSSTALSDNVENCRMIIRQFPCELLALFQEKNLAWQHVSQLLELEFKDTISKIPLEYIKLIQHFF